MNPDSDLAWIASVIGDPARSRILLALMDGRARTAKELAFLARVSAPTASAHLAKLHDGRLVAVEPRGRHRYFRLASAQVGQLIESLGAVAGEAARPVPRRSEAAEALAAARTCYDHLAGRLGVAVAEALQTRGHLLFADGVGELTPSGQALVVSLGLDLHRIPARRILCRPCLDWTERRFHLAGSLGAALCTHALEEGWVRRVRDSRALLVTDLGREGFAAVFGIEAAAFNIPNRRAA